MHCYFSFLRISLVNFIYGKKSPRKQEEIRKKRLKKLLTYAQEHSKYYQELYKGIDINNVELSDLPSVTKVDLMNHFNDWVTDKNVTKEELDEFTSHKENIGKKFKNKYIVYQTSGSTGAPITILDDDFTHDVAIGTGSLRNWPGGPKTMFRFYKKHKFAPKASVILPFDIFSISSHDAKEFINHLPKKRRKNTDFIEVSTPMKEILARLNQHQPNLVATYPTYMKMLCNYQKSGKLNISPTLVTTIGERLTDDIRKDIEDTFGSIVCTTYACTEGASITHECPQNHHQHLNDDWLIIEAVDADGNPVPYGQLSNKVFLTNLSNFTQPLIRYEITDRVILREGKECGCGDERLWIDVEGRSPVLLHFTDENNKRIDISSISISMEMHKVCEKTELYQFIIHKNNEIELRLKPLAGYDTQTVFKEIKEHLEGYLNKNHIVAYNIYLSNEAPGFDKSGKFKEIFQETGI